MSALLSSTERLKFALLAEGLSITGRALSYLADHNRGHALTPADYASTSGVILELDGHVWVNAPIADHNPNFVADSPLVLDFSHDQLFVRNSGVDCKASFWVSPAYHGTTGADLTPHNNYVITHSDRARVAPIMGCAMTCKFCNIPYEDRYGNKPVARLVEALRVAVADPVQPAHHALISGGTPRSKDYRYLREVYDAIMAAFPGLSVDVMMVPIDDVLDLKHLYTIGIDQLSINIELFNQDLARQLMRQKHAQGLDYYLKYLEQGAELFGGDRVRSMLMVGLEPLEDTLRGVEAIAQRGCIPVLSPFRPDPATPLALSEPPSAALLEEAFLRATEIATRNGVVLGPTCLPCTHNTLTLGADAGSATLVHRRPTMI
jgi:hypothetical protein